MAAALALSSTRKGPSQSAAAGVNRLAAGADDEAPEVALDVLVRVAHRLQALGLLRFAPTRFLHHYVYPLLAGRGAVPYDAGAFFQDWYVGAPAGEFSDGITLSHRYDPEATRFHYACVEASIARALADLGAPPRSVLDVGSGAGHWIDFYRSRHGAAVDALELAPRAAARLTEKYAADAAVRIRLGDVAAPDFALGRRYDAINAIGVLFHIVEDALWERALANLARHLEPSGVLLVSGQFGWLTQNVLFHGPDAYRRPGVPAGRFVHKRIRSLRHWRRAAARAGLRIERLLRSPSRAGLIVPENHLLALRARS